MLKTTVSLPSSKETPTSLIIVRVVAIGRRSRGSITGGDVRLVLRRAAVTGQVVTNVIRGSISGLERRRRHDALRGRGSLASGSGRGCLAIGVVALILGLLRVLLRRVGSWGSGGFV